MSNVFVSDCKAVLFVNHTYVRTIIGINNPNFSKGVTLSEDNLSIMI